MPTTRRTAAVIAAATLAVSLASPAMAGDRPTHVAFVHAVKKVYLHHDGGVTVRAWLRCKPGWAPAELDVRVNQGGAYTDGYIVPTVPCDNAFRRVKLRLPAGYGTLAVGDATVSSQFLVTNVDSGDSAAGHQDGKAVHILTR
jgi:hypothetical protein